MKKRLNLFLPILLLLLVFSSTACGTKTEQTGSNIAPQVNKQITQSENEDMSIQSTDKQETDKPLSEESDGLAEEADNSHMKLQIGEYIFTATLTDNSSTKALKAMLAEGPITINMRDYGNMEKVGPLGTNLPRNDEQITTEPGDLILYQGNALVIYYAPNSWNFTRIGKINDVTQEELKKALGKGDVKVTLSLD